MSKPTCSVDGCERPSHCRGWCSPHYKRWRRYDDVRADRPIGPVGFQSSSTTVGASSNGLCLITDCGQASRSRGLCSSHYAAEYRRLNPGKALARNRAWREANREYLREQSRKRNRELSEQRAEENRRYREKNLVRETARRLAWDKAHPERAAVRQRNVQAKRRVVEAAAYVADVDIWLLYEKQAGLCGLCGMGVDREISHPDPMSISLDHILPLSRGGTHEPDNCQVAHLRCNIRKGNRVTAIDP